MFKKVTVMVILYGFSMGMLSANLKIAISAKDFHDGNSIVFITRDVNGFEQVAGYVPLNSGKTEFSFDEISYHHKILSLIPDQKAAIFADEKEEFIKKDDDVIYLYFEIDAKVNIVRAIVITNNLLADNPFNVIEFSTSSIFNQVDEDEFDFFDSCNDEFSQLNLTDVQTNAPAELSFYNKTILALYAVWAIKSAQAKQVYKNFVQWLACYHAK